MALMAKARNGLLGGLRDGTLERLVNEMEEKDETATKETEAQAQAQAGSKRAGLSVLKKAKGNLIQGLKDGSLERLVTEMEVSQEKEVAAVHEAFQDLEGMELQIRDFVEAFRSNPPFQRKVALAAGVEQAELQALAADGLVELFQSMDIDRSGTLSFDEFVQGIVQIRSARRKEEQEAVIVEALVEAARAFEDAGLGRQGDLDLESFTEALLDPATQQQLSVATKLPAEYFQGLDANAAAELFRQIDADNSGSVSFNEWVSALVRTRMNLYQDQRAEEEQEERQKQDLLDEAYLEAEAAFQDADPQYKGELDIKAFIEALTDPFVIERVAYATKLPMEYFQSLNQNACAELFDQIDTDNSGTVSFEEWIKALLKIRLAKYEEEQENVNAVAQLAGDALDKLDETDEDWSGEFDFNKFLDAFKFNPRFLRKVSLATDVPIEEYRMLCDEDLEDLFRSLDTDFSGSVSFDEFVRGLLEIRSSRAAQKEGREEAERQDVLDEAYVDAVSAFEDADFEYKGELDLKAFTDALTDPAVVHAISYATKVPMEYFSALDEAACADFFKQIDTDNSGAVSFEEWVKALIRIRMDRYHEEKLEEKEVVAAVSQLAGSAMDDADEDWSGELDFRQFLHAFKFNHRFLQKVSAATGVPIVDFQELAYEDVENLFRDLDADLSGTVGFEEFVRGLMEIRIMQQRMTSSVHMAAPTAPPTAAPRLPEEAPVYRLPPEIQQLPPLLDKERARMDESLARYRQRGRVLQCTPQVVAAVLQDLYLWCDERSAKRYIDRAFPGRDVSDGIGEPDDWYVLYQVALHDQPVWTKPMTKSVFGSEPLTAKDVQGHESTMRNVYDKFARRQGGGMDADDMGEFFREAGLLDKDQDAPRVLADFERKRKPGPVFFPEVVELCNNMISRVLRNNPNPKLSRLPAIYPKRAYAPPQSGQLLLGNTGTGFARQRRKGNKSGAGRGRPAAGKATFKGVLPPL